MRNPGFSSGYPAISSALRWLSWVALRAGLLCCWVGLSAFITPLLASSLFSSVSVAENSASAFLIPATISPDVILQGLKCLPLIPESPIFAVYSLSILACYHESCESEAKIEARMLAREVPKQNHRYASDSSCRLGSIVGQTGINGYI